jgi:hypothetical protein
MDCFTISISNEDQRRSLEEQSATVLSLQQAVEVGRQALEVERKQVEGELPFSLPCFVDLPFGGSFPS